MDPINCFEQEQTDYSKYDKLVVSCCSCSSSGSQAPMWRVVTFLVSDGYDVAQTAICFFYGSL